jgi:hypothetical protein
MCYKLTPQEQEILDDIRRKPNSTMLWDEIIHSNCLRVVRLLVRKKAVFWQRNATGSITAVTVIAATENKCRGN